MTARADAPPVAAEHWRVISGSAIALRQWDDEVVVYVGGRAHTHLLSATAGSVLLGLIDATGAMTLQTLFASAFGEAAGATMTADEQAALRAVLNEFEQLGLVERAGQGERAERQAS